MSPESVPRRTWLVWTATMLYTFTSGIMNPWKISETRREGERDTDVICLNRTT